MFTSTNRNTSTLFSNTCLKYLSFKHFHLLILLIALSATKGVGQTYFNMSSGNYSEPFTAWSSPVTNSWSSVTISTGTIPLATATTVSSASFSSGTSDGVQNGTGATYIQFLTTDTTDNSSSVALDLNLNFMGRKAGTLSFDAATVFNSTGNRAGSLKVYYATNGTDWTELTGTNLPFAANNNVAKSATISVDLPKVLNNQATVKLRFYYYNGGPALASPTGSRPKISIDNIAVTTVNIDPNLLVISDFTNEIKSIKSGNWNDPTTWDCTCVPTLLDNVHVRNPHVITVIPAATEQGCAKILIELGAVFKLQTGLFKINVPNLQSDNTNLAMGNPSGATPDVSNPNNYLLEKPQYIMSYNRSRGTSNWVSWYLGSSSLGTAPRQNDFRPDTSLPNGWYEVTATDYSGSGFDRGNMTPSGDRTSTVANNSATFLMTNMVPQAPDNNQGPWEQLESYLRTQVSNNQEMYVISGSYGTGGTGSNGSANTVAGGQVTVPAQLFKIAVILADGSDDVKRVTTSTRVIAVIMPNVQGIRTNDWRQYRTSVDNIEAITGYDFLSNVPTYIQNVIEAAVDAM